MEADPGGIPNDRALIQRIEDDSAVLAVGPSRTPMHVPVDDLPEGATPDTWVMVDLQLQPPMVIAIDQAMTDERR